MARRIVTILILAAAAAVLTLTYSQWRQEPLRVSGFLEGDEIRLGSRLGGRVLAVHIQEGQLVTPGQVLVELEPFDLLEQQAQAQAELAGRQAELRKLQAGFRAEEIAQAQARHDRLAARLEELVSGPRKQEIAAARAQLEMSEAQLNLSRLRYDQIKAVYDRRSATQEEMDTATDQLRASQAAVEHRRQQLNALEVGTRTEVIAQAKAELEEARQAWLLLQAGFRPQEIEQARAAVQAAEAALARIARQIEELTIRSPLEAVVEAVDLQPGDLVASNAPVVALMDPSKLWVRAYVPENHLNLQLNQHVYARVDSFPGRRFAGRIAFIARQGEFMPGNIQTPEERSKQVFRIKVTLEEGLEVLRPGMVADIELPSEARR